MTSFSLSVAFIVITRIVRYSVFCNAGTISEAFEPIKRRKMMMAFRCTLPLESLRARMRLCSDDLLLRYELKLPVRLPSMISRTSSSGSLMAMYSSLFMICSIIYVTRVYVVAQADRGR